MPCAEAVAGGPGGVCEPASALKTGEEKESPAYARAIKLDTNISTGLVHVAAENGLPIKVIPRKAGLLDGDKFFGNYASRRIHFVDKALQDDMHGSMTHILQDLVVDRALKAAGKKMSSGEFRALLGKAEGAFKAGKKAERLKEAVGV